ncbi:hypothetical protein VULLAG_LOCUS6208 [Vulpes lagopus]
MWPARCPTAAAPRGGGRRGPVTGPVWQLPRPAASRPRATEPAFPAAPACAAPPGSAPLPRPPRSRPPASGAPAAPHPPRPPATLASPQNLGFETAVATRGVTLRYRYCLRFSPIFPPALPVASFPVSHSGAVRAGFTVRKMFLQHSLAPHRPE